MVWCVTFLAFKRQHRVSSCLLEASESGVQLVTRPGVFTVFDPYQVYIPLISFEIVSSAQFAMRSSALHLPGAVL